MAFEQDTDEEEQAETASPEDEVGDDDEEVTVKPAYQMYTDAGFKAQRYLGPVSLQRTPDWPLPMLVTSGPALPGDLMLVSPALAFVPGGFQEVPELEDLHAELLEAGPPPPQRRVLSVLETLRPPAPPAPAAADPAAAAPSAPPAQALPSLTTLDPKFWAGRGRDASAPTMASRRLKSLLMRTATASDSQDPAAMQARHEKPLGYMGLWPESALLGHSCVPNTSQLVVSDRMFVHLTEEATKAGLPLTRNMIGSCVTAPLSVRQAAVAEVLRDLGVAPEAPPQEAAEAVSPEAAEAAADAAAAAEAAGGEALLTACRCPRCQLEASVSEELRDTLESAHLWYVNEASAVWNSANEAEDVGILRGLLAEAEVLVGEVEEGVANEPGLDDEQQDWLRASVYDVYDMLVILDELVNQQGADPDYLRTCLELIRVCSPGSDNHFLVALKHEALRSTRYEAFGEMLQRERGGPKSVSKGSLRKLALLKEAADTAADFRVEAAVMRYGFIKEETLGALTEGLEAYMDGLEQLSAMRAQGMEELTREMEVNGVKVQIVDKLEVSESARVGSGAPGRKVLSADGMQVMVVEDGAPEGERKAAGRVVAVAGGEDGEGPVVEVMEGGDGEGGDGEEVDEEGEVGELALDADGNVELDDELLAALEAALAADMEAGQAEQEEGAQ